MPEIIKNKGERIESETDKMTEKIIEHLNYWGEKERHLLFRDGVQAALVGKENSKEFQKLKEKRYRKQENAKKTVEKIKRGKPPDKEKLKDLVYYLNRPGRNEEEIQKIIEMHSESLKENGLKANEQKHIEARLAFHKGRLDFYAEERKSLLEKIESRVPKGDARNEAPPH